MIINRAEKAIANDRMGLISMQCRVKFKCVNEIYAILERPCVNVKVERDFNVYA